MKFSMRFGAAVSAVLVLSACATVTRGTKQKYAITSTPTGAAVVLSTGDKCFTPCKLKLKRKNGFTATATKAGYQPVEAKVASKFAGGGGAAAAGNVLIGGIIGAAVDGSNGSLNSLFPGKLDLTLKPIEVAAEQPSVVTTAEAPVAPAEVPASAPSQAAPVAATPAPAPSGL
jgi:hypothetical protein